MERAPAALAREWGVVQQEIVVEVFKFVMYKVSYDVDVDSCDSRSRRYKNHSC